MAVAKALVDNRIRQQLTPAGVQLALDSLWAVDCQACGRSLAGQKPALAVDDMITHVVARLYHPSCRASCWNDDGAIPMASGALLTHMMHAILVPMQAQGGPVGYRGFFLLNPGLESVNLVRSGDGWTVQMETPFADAGMTPPGQGLLIDQPIPGAFVKLGSGQVAFHLRSGLLAPYVLHVNEQMTQQVVADRGLMAVVTHALNPSELVDPRQMEPVMRGDRSLFGWVGLSD